MAVKPLAGGAARLPLLRRAAVDAPLVVAALAQGILALAVIAGAQAGVVPLPVAAVAFAVGLWWCSNTIAHVHIHTPLFRARRHNRLFALYLGGLVGVPQSIWRARHLWHHAGEPADRPARAARGPLILECGLIAAVCAMLAVAAPAAFFGAWLPGFVLGLGLCQVHGHYEHAGAALSADPGVSCYRRLYNRLWLNDGHHAEHHRWPGCHWSELPARRLPAARASRWPPVLRWLEPAGRGINRAAGCGLNRLEQLALWSPALSRFALDRHERALAALWPRLDGRPLRRIGIVGGGLFPRTAIVLRRRLPGSTLVVIESNPQHIDRAKSYLAGQADLAGSASMSGDNDAAGSIQFICASFEPAALNPMTLGGPFDLIIVPLGYRGDRNALYAHPPAPLVLIHDWLWRRRGNAGVVVSTLLLKRLNLAVGQAQEGEGRGGLEAARSSADDFRDIESQSIGSRNDIDVHAPALGSGSTDAC